MPIPGPRPRCSPPFEAVNGAALDARRIRPEPVHPSAPLILVVVGEDVADVVAACVEPSHRIEALSVRLAEEDDLAGRQVVVGFEEVGGHVTDLGTRAVARLRGSASA